MDCCIGPSSDDATKARIDIKKVSMVDGVSLHDEITLTITGKVISIRGPEEYVGTAYVGEGKKPKKVDRSYPGSLEVEVSSAKLSVVNQFDGMDQDDD